MIKHDLINKLLNRPCSHLVPAVVVVMLLVVVVVVVVVVDTGSKHSHFCKYYEIS